ncbi:MAG: HepT-like ribonuclease domain-containing protein [bacterium]
MSRDDTYLLDMLLAARKIRHFAERHTKEAFQADELMQLGIVHLIQIIGEAARGVSAGFQDSHPEIPWLEVIGMRHRLVHDYLNIDIDRVWKTLEDDIPRLIGHLEVLVEGEGK